jgi:hypothetical protein
MRTTTDVTGGYPIAVLLQFISGVSAINPLVVFYDIHERKILYSAIWFWTPRETRNMYYVNMFKN